MVWWRFDLQKCRYLFSQLPSPSSNSKKDFLSFVSPFFSWYYFSILFSLSLAPKPQSHADWVADQFKQQGFSAAKRRLAGVLWSLQYFVCGHTIKDLGVAIGRMWKSDPGSPHPTNSFSFLLFFSFSSMFLPSFLVFVSLHLSPALTLPPFILVPSPSVRHTLLPLLTVLSLMFILLFLLFWSPSLLSSSPYIPSFGFGMSFSSFSLITNPTVLLAHPLPVSAANWTDASAHLSGTNCQVLLFTSASSPNRRWTWRGGKRKDSSGEGSVHSSNGCRSRGSTAEPYSILHLDSLGLIQ